MIPVCIIPTLVQYELLDEMIASIDYPIEELIIIDNGGSLKSCLHSKFVARTHIISMPNNLGVAASWNLGIKLTPYAKWWLIASDDIKWTDGSLAQYSRAMDTDVIVGDWEFGGSFSAFAVNESVVAKVGLFDDYYYPGVGEELNYMIRARHSGIKFRHIPYAFTTNPGMTRKLLISKFENADNIFNDNWDSSHSAGIVTRGWNIDNRRKCELNFKELF